MLYSLEIQYPDRSDFVYGTLAAVTAVFTVMKLQRGIEQMALLDTRGSIIDKWVQITNWEL
jgi:hypothetical protein